MDADGTLPEIQNGNWQTVVVEVGVVKGGRREVAMMVKVVHIWGHCFYWILSFKPYISRGIH